MDRKDEIIQLQMDVINQMTRSNLSRIADDLWSMPALPSLNEQPQSTQSNQPVPKAEAGIEEKPQAAVSAVKETAQEQPVEPMETLMKELNEYIGLATVKKEVESLINLVTVQKMRREHELPTNDLSLHMVFSGNPGTGKTMIARLMARIYRSLGILSKGHLVEVDRGGLVAGFVGQTAIKTGEVIQKALGGVLFIDEAYALTNHGGNDYGQEAVDTLLKAMEDHREDLIVIVAGYVELMEEFIHSNPGLESRFNRFLNFEDYTVQEMLDIFDLHCKKCCYELAPDARDLLKSLLALYSIDVKGFGNARGVRNLFERAISAQANRLAKQQKLTREELMKLSCDDIREASGAQEGSEQPPVGSEKPPEAKQSAEAIHDYTGN
ncbi:MAG: AAA family ATPase [Clostridia bacterium]